MPDNDFTVILDKRDEVKLPGVTIPSFSLMGKPIYREGSTGLAEALQEVKDQGLILAPTYSLVAGRAFVGKKDEAWSQYHDSNAERDTVLDEEGILGEKGVVYALDIQNGGLFVWNPQRIKEAVEGCKLVNYALQLEQDEVNVVLDAMKKGDTVALKQIVHGGNVAFAGNYDGFLEASASPDFIQGMDTTYVIIRPASEAGQVYSGKKAISEQRDNPDIIIASGGKAQANRMLDQAEGFGWNQFGAWNDGYKHNNTGRSVVLNLVSNGIYGNRDLYIYGLPVGVAPEALDAFYKQKNVDPLTVIVNQAIRTARPVQHGDGVVLYLSGVQAKE
ncbi:MAG: hypothetical protein V1740_02970 [Candidatus Woesearchaeota archaeon]